MLQNNKIIKIVVPIDFSSFSEQALKVAQKNQFKIGQLFAGSYAQQFVNHSQLPV